MTERVQEYRSSHIVVGTYVLWNILYFTSIRYNGISIKWTTKPHDDETRKWIILFRAIPICIVY